MDDKEAKRLAYVEWRKDKDRVRVKAMEDLGRVIMDMIVGGHEEDGMMLLPMMDVVFEELDTDLVKGILSEVTKKDRPAPVKQANTGLN